MVQLANLRAAMADERISHQAGLEALEHLDQQLSRLTDEMPPSWQYQTIFPKGATHMFAQYYHIYRDHHVTQTWNVIRLNRIMITEMIRERQLDKSDLMDETISKIRRIASHICASTTQYIKGLQSRLEMDEEDQGHCTVSSSSPDKILQQQEYGRNDHAMLLMQCYTLIFPLYVAGRSPFSDMALKLWVITELRYMANTFKIRNAGLVASMLEHGGSEDAWTVYATLGSYAFAA